MGLSRSEEDDVDIHNDLARLYTARRSVCELEFLTDGRLKDSIIRSTLKTTCFLRRRRGLTLRYKLSMKRQRVLQVR